MVALLLSFPGGCGVYDLLDGVIEADPPSETETESPDPSPPDGLLPDTGPVDTGALPPRNAQRCTDGATAICTCAFLQYGYAYLCTDAIVAELQNQCVSRIPPDGATIDCWADYASTIATQFDNNPLAVPPACFTASETCSSFQGMP